MPDASPAIHDLHEIRKPVLNGDPPPDDPQPGNDTSKGDRDAIVRPKS
jgi:hypothetical protein